MERLLDRAFNKAHGTAQAVVGTAAAAEQQRHKKQQQSREDALRALTTPMTSADVVERIGLAHKDDDFFRLLQLPGPALDELGRAVWPVGAGELAKAYRQLSRLVHPDKDPRPEARAAFEQLQQAYGELRDADKLAARLRAAEPALKAAAERAAATASVSDKVQLNAAAEERKAQLRQQEARSFHQEIQQQMRRRAEQAALKKQRAEASKYKRQGGGSSSSDDGGGDSGGHGRQQRGSGGGSGSGDGSGSGAKRHGGPAGGGEAAAAARARNGGGSSSDEEEEVRRPALTKRKKLKFM